MSRLWLAFAMLIWVAPAGAGELTLSPRPVQIKDTDASRLYRAKWVKAYRRATARSVLSDERYPAQSIDELDALPEPLRAKVRRLVALMVEEARSAPGPQLVRFRLRVRCKTRHVVEAGAPDLAEPSLARPALMWQAVVSEPKPTRVRSTVRACSIKFVRSKRPIDRAGPMRPYSVTLPAFSVTSD